jgi:UTP--glucose-1-phosphate uridylyltransferase
MIMARQVGAVVLAGGMATRFGGVVKAVVPADGDRSFFQCKLDDARALAVAAGAPIPLLLMSSFATHDALVAHVGGASNVSVFPQYAALRLSPDGELFREENGELSPYATGHGDLTFALRSSGALARFRDAGGTTLLMSNVDNLAATLDPAIIGLHAELGGAITAEVVRKIKGDKGGAPALLDGVPQIIEGFRFPPAFDQDAIQVFNTNTFVLDAAAIDRDFALPYYRVEKQVDGRAAVQFERLVGELTATLPTRFVEVPRAGEDARFLPAKDPEELDRSRAAIADVLSSQRSLHG